MAWEAGHRPLIWDYWMNGGFDDFGDVDNTNGFARRIREMMGEQSLHAPWTQAMEAAFLAFVQRFYVCPPQLDVTGRTFTGQLKYQDTAHATRVKKGTQRLTLASLLQGGPSRLKLTLIGAGHPELDEDKAVIRALMKVYLLRGFIPYARTDAHRIVGVPQQQFLAQFLSEMPNGAPTIDQFVRRSLKTVQGAAAFAWRGDSRPWKDVEAADGLHSKVISNSRGFLESTNLINGWHVFSEDDFRNHMYWRRNSKDNCLDTCVSVSLVGYRQQDDGMEHRTNATFPQLSVIPAQWRSKTYVEYRNSGGQTVRESRTVDKVQLYLVTLPIGTRYIDTGGAQAMWKSPVFPEISVRGVPRADVLGTVTFVRVHHGEGDSMEEGFDAIPVVDPAANLQTPDRYTVLRREVQGARDVFDRANARFSRGWRSDGSAEVAPLAATWISVGGVPVRNGRIEGLPQMNVQVPQARPLNPKAPSLVPKSTLNPHAPPFMPSSRLNPKAQPHIPRWQVNPFKPPDK